MVQRFTYHFIFSKPADPTTAMQKVLLNLQILQQRCTKYFYTCRSYNSDAQSTSKPADPTTAMHKVLLYLQILPQRCTKYFYTCRSYHSDAQSSSKPADLPQRCTKFFYTADPTTAMHKVLRSKLYVNPSIKHLSISFTFYTDYLTSSRIHSDNQKKMK